MKAQLGQKLKDQTLENKQILRYLDKSEMQNTLLLDE